MNKELEEHKTYYLKPLYISSRYITNDEKGLIREYIDKQDKEIERLNNVINELEEDIKDYRKILEQGITDKVDYIYLGSVLQFLDNILDKLQELKGSDK